MSENNTQDNPSIEADNTNPDNRAEKVKLAIKEIAEKNKIALEAMREGKGRLRLEKPFNGAGGEIAELAYDFTSMTGLDYTTAMDSDPNARNNYKISYRQGLALFATAAAKQTPSVDSRDITEMIGITDALEGVQLATSFFEASTRAGRMRISKM